MRRRVDNRARGVGALVLAAAVALVAVIPASAQVTVEELCAQVAAQGVDGATASPAVDPAASPAMDPAATPAMDPAASPATEEPGMSEVTAELLQELCTRAGLGTAESPDAEASEPPMEAPEASPAGEASPAAG